MNRRFRLATLQRLRENAVQEATANLGKRRVALGEAEMQLHMLRKALLCSVVGPHSTPQEVSAQGLHREVLREKAEHAQTQVSHCRAEVVAAMEHWHRRRAEMRAVEKLHERHRESLADLDARREQRQSDELAATALLLARAGHHDPDGSAA